MGYVLTVFSTFLNTLTSGVAMHLVFSVGGIFFLGLPTVNKISAYALAILEKNGTDPIAAFVLAGIVSALVWAAFAVATIRMNTESLAAVSIGSILATEAVLQSLDAFTGGILGISGIARPEILATLPRLALGGAVIVIGILLFEAVLLQTPFGRALRAYREAPDTLDGMGVSSIRLVQTAIVTGSVITSVSASFFTWRVQFIDPSIAGIPTLIELLTISIIAFRPRVRAVAVATVFVTFLPETLRFLHLPATSFGQLRILVYSVLLIVLLHAFAPYFHFSKRSV